MKICMIAEVLPEFPTDNHRARRIRRQRQWLLKQSNTASKDDQDVLEGIVALLDEIADQAHDRHGINCLLDEEATDIQGRPENRGP